MGAVRCTMLLVGWIVSGESYRIPPSAFASAAVLIARIICNVMLLLDNTLSQQSMQCVAYWFVVHIVVAVLVALGNILGGWGHRFG